MVRCQHVGCEEGDVDRGDHGREGNPEEAEGPVEAGFPGLPGPRQPIRGLEQDGFQELHGQAAITVFLGAQMVFQHQVACCTSHACMQAAGK